MQRLAVGSVVVKLRQKGLKNIFKMESKFVIFLLCVFMADTTVVNSQGKKTTVSLSSCDI